MSTKPKRILIALTSCAFLGACGQSESQRIAPAMYVIAGVMLYAMTLEEAAP